MAQNKVDTGEVVTGLLVRKTYKGQDNWDKTYKQVEQVEKVVPVGDTKDGNYSIQVEEIVTEVPIRETIQAQADGVGIQAYMKPYEMAGLGLPNVNVSDEVQDFSNFPDDPDDIAAVGDAAQQAFNNLDPRLKGDAKTIEDFINGLTPEKVAEYLALFTKKAEESEKK